MKEVQNPLKKSVLNKIKNRMAILCPYLPLTIAFYFKDKTLWG